MSFHTSVEHRLLRCLQRFIYLDIQGNGQSIILMDPCSRWQEKEGKRCLAEGEEKRQHSAVIIKSHNI